MQCHVDMLTLEEKWYFDHHGFLILRKVIPQQDIREMIALGHQWHAMKLGDLPQPLTSTADTHPDSHLKVGMARSKVIYEFP